MTAPSDPELARRLAQAVPPNVRAVCRTLTAAGHQAVTVGGAVRDAILGRAPGDWDVATSARPEQVIALFPHTVPTGLQHGTVTVVTGRGATSHVEVTTFRGEGAYSDARRPDHVTFGVPLIDDLARRDLRVNAIAYDPEANALIDPYGGQTDIAERRLRAVGPTGRVYDDAVARFTEDGLRVMRAVRFAAALEFELDPDTERGIAPALPSLARVSKERICDELRKILAARQPSRALAIAERTGILALILPEHEAGITAWAAARGEPRAAQLARWLARVDRAIPAARLAALLADLAPPGPVAREVDAGRGEPDVAAGGPRAGAPRGIERSETGRGVSGGASGGAGGRRLDRSAQRAAEAVLRRLKFSNDECAAAAVAIGAASAVLLAGWSDAEIRRLLADVTRPHAAVATALWHADGAGELADRADAILARGDALAVGELAVAGKDLMAALALQPGPQIGRLLAALVDRVLDDPSLNQREALIALARSLER